MHSAGESGKRVLFMAKYLDSGGVTTHMMTLAKELQKSGWEVAVASGGSFGDHPRGPAWFESEGVQHFNVGYNSRNPLTLLAQLVRTIAVVREFKPDLIHVHWRVTSMFAQVARLTTRTPFVTTIHLLGIGEGRLHRLFSYWGSRTIAISSECSAYLQEAFNVPKDRIDIIFNGADSTHFRTPSMGERTGARHQFGLDADECVISLIGRLEEVKGHALLLQAVAPLVAQGNNISILFAGEGSQKAELQALAAALGLADRVQFLGHTDPRQVLWASDVSVLPSYKEGFPLSTVEAMLCGVATIRSNTSGANDVILDGETGFIIPVGDKDALQECVLRLISQPDLRKELSQAARLRALDLFTSERMVAQTMETYQRALTRETLSE